MRFEDGTDPLIKVYRRGDEPHQPERRPVEAKSDFIVLPDATTRFGVSLEEILLAKHSSYAATARRRRQA